MGEWNESAVVTVIIVSVLLLFLCCAGNRKNFKCRNLKHPNRRMRRRNTTKGSRCSRESSCRTATFTYTPDERSFNTSSCQSSTRSSARPGELLEDEIREMLSPFPQRPRLVQSHVGVYKHQQSTQTQQPWSYSGGRSFHGTTNPPLPRASIDEVPWSRSVSLPTKIRPQQKKQYPKSPPPTRNDRIMHVNFLPEDCQFSDTDEETNIKGSKQTEQSSVESQSISVSVERPLFATCVRKQPKILERNRHQSFKEQRQQPVVIQQVHHQIDQDHSQSQHSQQQFVRSKHLSLIKSNKPMRERQNSLDMTSRPPLYARNNDTIFEECSDCSPSSQPQQRSITTGNIGKGILIRRYEREQEARMREMEMYYQYYDEEDTPINSLSPSSLTTTYPDTTESSCDFERFNFVTVRQPYFIKE